jgi:hypothetical protein
MLNVIWSLVLAYRTIDCRLKLSLVRVRAYPSGPSIARSNQQQTNTTTLGRIASFGHTYGAALIAAGIPALHADPLNIFSGFAALAPKVCCAPQNH